MKLPRRLLLAAILAIPAAGHADGTASFGDYRIHYAAQPTARLQPDIARHYGITRSRVQAMVVISIKENDQPVAAHVSGNAYTDAGQQRDIRFRRVEAAGVVNHVGTFRVDHLETLRFEIDVRPETGQQSYPVRFRETFFME